MQPVSDTKIVPTGDRFDLDTSNSLGLSLRVRGGTYLDGYGFKSAPNVTLTLTASATNYVEISAAGVISTNTTGFSASVTQLYVVTTNATVVTNLIDARVVSGTNDGLNGGAAGTVASLNTTGGVPVLHRIGLSAGAIADTDVVLKHKTRVIDAWLVLDGAGVATTTLAVKNGATAITDAMAASGTNKAVVRCATIDDAQAEIAAAGTLRISSATGASQPAATVYVLGIRVA